MPTRFVRNFATLLNSSSSLAFVRSVVEAAGGGFTLEQLLPNPGYTIGVDSIQPSSGPGFDDSLREIGNVLDTGVDGPERYIFVYSGHDGAYAGNNVYIQWAVSPDAVTWDEKGNVLTSRSLEDPYLVLHNGTFYLYAEDKADVPFRNIRLHTATSMAGPWTDLGDTIDVSGSGWDNTDVSSPVVWIEGSTWYLLYEGRNGSGQGSIGLATSSDGITWTKEPTNPVLDRLNTWGTHYIVPNDVRKSSDGTYVMLFHGTPNTDNSDIRLGAATSTDLLNWTPVTDHLSFPKPQLESAFCPVNGEMKYLLLVEQGGVAPKPARMRLVDQGIGSSLTINFTGANGSTSFTDISGWNQTLLNTGDVQIQNNRAVFDGNGDYVRAINDEIYQLSDYDWTLEGFKWKFNTTAGNQVLMAKFGSSPQFSWYHGWRGDLATPSFRMLGYTSGSGGSFFVDAPFSPVVGTEYDVCFERRGTVGRIYVDGVMIGSGSLGTNKYFKNTTIATVGANLFSSASGFMNGSLAAVRLTKGLARYQTDGSYTVPTLPLAS